MRKLIDSLIVAGAIGFASILALIGVFFAMGVLDKPKLIAIGDVMAGRRPAVTPVPSASPLPLPPAEQARSAKALADAIESQQAEFNRKREELNKLAQQLNTLALELQKRRKEIEVKEKSVQQTIDDFLKTQTAAAQEREQKGFKDSLKVFEAMRPEEAARLLSTFSDQEVVEYLKAFDPRFAAKVLSSMAKTGAGGELRAAELQKLLSQGGMASQPLPAFAGSSGAS